MVGSLRITCVTQGESRIVFVRVAATVIPPVDSAVTLPPVVLTLPSKVSSVLVPCQTTSVKKPTIQRRRALHIATRTVHGSI